MPTAKRSSLREERRNLKKQETAERERFLFDVILVILPVILLVILSWAQIATLFRLHGLRDKFHDFLFSPVLGGELERTRQGIRLSEDGLTFSPYAMVQAG